MKKIVWVSRHEMTEVQKADLRNLLSDNIEVETKNITWSATWDISSDMTINKFNWKELSEYDIIVGVFPPVAIESIGTYPNKPVMSPVSEQSKTLRADGTSAIEFKHVRFANIMY